MKILKQLMQKQIAKEFVKCFVVLNLSWCFWYPVSVPLCCSVDFCIFVCPSYTRPMKRVFLCQKNILQARKNEWMTRFNVKSLQVYQFSISPHPGQHIQYGDWLPNFSIFSYNNKSPKVPSLSIYYKLRKYYSK